MKTNETFSRRALPSALTTRLLVWLGLRSGCCGARLYEPTGVLLQVRSARVVSAGRELAGVVATLRDAARADA